MQTFPKWSKARKIQGWYFQKCSTNNSCGGWALWATVELRVTYVHSMPRHRCGPTVDKSTVLGDFTVCTRFMSSRASSEARFLLDTRWFLCDVVSRGLGKQTGWGFPQTWHDGWTKRRKDQKWILGRVDPQSGFPGWNRSYKMGWKKLVQTYGLTENMLFPFSNM